MAPLRTNNHLPPTPPETTFHVRSTLAAPMNTQAVGEVQRPSSRRRRGSTAKPISVPNARAPLLHQLVTEPIDDDDDGQGSPAQHDELPKTEDIEEVDSAPALPAAGDALTAAVDVSHTVC